jgi:hypothetical protein
VLVRRFFCLRQLFLTLCLVNQLPNLPYIPVAVVKAGHATIKFNAAIKPSTYTIIAQEIDYNGNIGCNYKR